MWRGVGHDVVAWRDAPKYTWACLFRVALAEEKSSSACNKGHGHVSRNMMCD